MLFRKKSKGEKNKKPLKPFIIKTQVQSYIGTGVSERPSNVRRGSESRKVNITGKNKSRGRQVRQKNAHEWDVSGKGREEKKKRRRRKKEGERKRRGKGRKKKKEKRERGGRKKEGEKKKKKGIVEESKG